MEKPATPSRARRRLLLAATGTLPSVLTLSSGAQAAATSTLRCLASNQPAQRFTPTDDNWVRAQVPVASYNARPAYCVTSPTNACVDNAHNATPGTRWVVDGNTMTVDQQTLMQVQNGQRSYGLVYVDQTGSITTLDPGSNGNLVPVTDSCWTSIVGGRTSSLG
jgi:hypothetical protein